MVRPRNFVQSKVLHKAMNLFWNKGYEGTSLSDLLKVTGLSKSSLYETFGSKHDLFIKSFQLYRKKRMQVLSGYLTGGVTALQGVNDFFQAVVEYETNSDRPLGCMTVNEAIELAPHNPEFQKMVQQDFLDVENAFFHAIQIGQSDGSITLSKDAKSLARYLTITLQGLNVMARAQTDKEHLKVTVDIMIQALQ